MKGLLSLYYYENARAQELFTRILESDPTNISALWGMAELQHRNHNYASCKDSIEKILRDEPTFSPAYVTLGFNEFVQAKFDNAIIYAHKTLAISNPKIAHARAAAYILLAACKGMKAAKASYFSKIMLGPQIFKHIDQAHALMPDTPEVLFGSGICYMLAPHMFYGNDVKAKELFLESIEKRPAFPDVYVRLAQLYKRQNDHARSQALIQQAMQRDPQNVLLKDFLQKKNVFITQS
ncbi:tetratricopeptide repeat protein [Candidatus Omnitrophota bacterium]